MGLLMAKDIDNTCRCCIEIKSGLKILASISFIYLILLIASAVVSVLTFNIIALLRVLVCFPEIMAGWYSAKWLMADNHGTRRGFIFAQVIGVLVSLASGVLTLFGILMGL